MPDLDGGDKKKRNNKRVQVKTLKDGTPQGQKFDLTRLQDVTPAIKCKLRFAKQSRIKDYLLLEQEYIQMCEQERRNQATAKDVD